ncbi:MAG: 3-dehydroquinate synthase [Pseudomonadota bacterium]|nr:3-dehydroquinate synthase [Pseudomonadota bacterium]
MRTLNVSLGERSYPILIAPGLLSDGPQLARLLPARDLLLVSNTTVAPLYAAPVRAALADRRIVDVRLPDGEQYKTLEYLQQVLDVAVANRFARDCIVVALGGGVVGDLAGFAAACYQRGVAFAQLPTTLLAQVDSSVGGKTGVNHPGGKNMIGAFHQPCAVVADTTTLRTLPPRELRAGLAEVVKYGLIFDLAFLEWIEANVDRLLALDDEAMAHAIYRSCELKADVVCRDERETGDRALLNLGHTFGHAIETGTGYTEWLHGEAVAAGMVVAADMSARLGLLQAGDVKRIRELLARIGLPVDPPRFGAQRALDYMSVDKKVKSGRIRLVLLERLGAARFTADYGDDALQSTLAAHFG